MLARRDKMGFETPTDLWLRGRYAGEVRRRLLFYGPLHEWVDPAALRDELEDYLDGRRADRAPGLALAVARGLGAALPRRGSGVSGAACGCRRRPRGRDAGRAVRTRLLRA